jgi:hypothetical protein
MSDKDAGRPANVPERPWKVGGGTAEGSGHARQTETACDDQARELPPITMEEVLRRENMLKAYHRVTRNGGAPGIDGMSVEKLGNVLGEAGRESGKSCSTIATCRNRYGRWKSRKQADEGCGRWAYPR